MKTKWERDNTYSSLKEAKDDFRNIFKSGLSDAEKRTWMKLQAVRDALILLFVFWFCYMIIR